MRRRRTCLGSALLALLASGTVLPAPERPEVAAAVVRVERIAADAKTAKGLGCRQVARAVNQSRERGVLAWIRKTEHLTSGDWESTLVLALLPRQAADLGCAWWPGAVRPADYTVLGASRLDPGRGEREAGVAPTGDPSVWVGPRWTLEVFAEGDREDPVVEGTEVTLRFREGGRVDGSSGCNRYHARYRGDPTGGLEILELRTTGMTCYLPHGRQQQEERYLRALANAVAVGSDGFELHLYGAEPDAPVLRFRRSEP